MKSRVKIKENLIPVKREDGLIDLVSNGVVVSVVFTNIEDLKDAVKVMEDNQIYKCNVIIKSTDHSSELSMIDELPYLEELDKKGYDINFFYDYITFKKFPLNRIIEDEKRLNLAVKELNESDLSPLEKFIAVYDIVNYFKPYKEEDVKHVNGEFSLSRCLHQYLDSNYMVCAGYADLLSNLCKRIGIESSYYDFGIVRKDTSHARCYIHLKDPKYNIDGYYITDPTARRIGKNLYHGGLPASDVTSFLCTTEEQKLNEEIKEVGFGSFELTEKEFLEKAKLHGDEFKKELCEQLKDLDSAFVKQLEIMNFDREEDVLNAKDYIDSKINNRISFRNLVDALIQEKRFIFRNEDESYFDELRYFYESELCVDELEPEGMITSNMKIGEIKKGFPDVYGIALSDEINGFLDDESLIWDPATQNIIVTNVDIEVFNHLLDFSLKGYRLSYVNQVPFLVFPAIRNPEKYTLDTYIGMLQEQVKEYNNIRSLKYYQKTKKKN